MARPRRTPSKSISPNKNRKDKKKEKTTVDVTTTNVGCNADICNVMYMPPRVLCDGAVDDADYVHEEAIMNEMRNMLQTMPTPKLNESEQKHLLTLACQKFQESLTRTGNMVRSTCTTDSLMRECAFESDQFVSDASQMMENALIATLQQL